MLTPKYKAEKLGIEPRSQSYHSQLDVWDGTNLSQPITPRILLPTQTFLALNQYYASPLHVVGASDLTWTDFAIDKIWAYAFPITRRLKFTKVAINIVGVGAAGAKLRLALYKSANDGLPQDLLQDFGEVDATTTGIKVIDFSTSAITLDREVCWLCHNGNDGTIDLLGFTGSLGVFGYATEPATGPSFSVVYTYGAFPATFPTGDKAILRIALRFGLYLSEVID